MPRWRNVPPSMPVSPLVIFANCKSESRPRAITWRSGRGTLRSVLRFWRSSSQSPSAKERDDEENSARTGPDSRRSTELPSEAEDKSGQATEEKGATRGKMIDPELMKVFEGVKLTFSRWCISGLVPDCMCSRCLHDKGLPVTEETELDAEKRS